MRRLVVLGAGTAGTMVVNKLRRRLARSQWQITVVEAGEQHFYQPGFLSLPFGAYAPEQVAKPIGPLIADGVELVRGEVRRVIGEESRVVPAGGRSLPYDYLVIATGVSPRPTYREDRGRATAVHLAAGPRVTCPGAESPDERGFRP